MFSSKRLHPLRPQRRIIEQARQWAAKREAGESLREIAAEVGVSHMTVARRCNTEAGMPEKALHRRQRTTYQIQSGTKPETAAAKIRATFDATAMPGRLWTRVLSTD